MPGTTRAGGPSSRVVTPLLLAAIGGAVVLAVGLGLLPPPVEPIKVTAAYLLALLFGCLVGATELSGRYRDRPLDAILSAPGRLYMAVNALAALIMVWLLFTRRLQPGFTLFGTDHPLLDALVLGSFGAMALFRSAVFTVRVRETNVAVGPAAVLQEILRATDREVDRLQAGPRAAGVKEIMRHVVFRRAKDSLPAHCLNLMQNVAPEERDSLSQAITALDSRPLSDEAKSYSLGLMLMNLVGEEVLSQAVAGLGDRIRGPVPDEPPVLDRVASLAEGDLLPMLEFCVALAPETAEAVRERRREANPAFRLEDLIAAPNGITGPKDKVLIGLARLRHAFGQETVAEALRLLIGLRGTVVQAELSAEDLRGGPGGDAGGGQPQPPPPPESPTPPPAEGGNRGGAPPAGPAPGNAAPPGGGAP